MNEESVRVERDTGHRLQWAKGIFYRKEGAKMTLIPRSVTIALGLVFLLCVVSILVTDDASQRPDGAPVPVKLQQTSAQQDAPQIQSLYDYEKQVARIRIENHDAQSAKDHQLHQAGQNRAGNFTGLDRKERVSEILIPPGSFAEAKLLQSASDGLVKAALSKGLQYRNETILPEGTGLIGTGRSTDNRLMINFTRAILPDGTALKIKASACDPEDRSLGIPGHDVNQQVLRIAGSIGLNFLSGAAEGLQEKRGQGGVEVRDSSPKNALLNGTKKAGQDEAQRIMEDARSATPRIEVPQDSLICVFFPGDLDD
jgi:type IV secretory pathway VirB10-like protein